jgi:hypothetical protein
MRFDSITISHAIQFQSDMKDGNANTGDGENVKSAM